MRRGHKIGVGPTLSQEHYSRASPSSAGSFLDATSSAQPNSRMDRYLKKSYREQMKIYDNQGSNAVKEVREGGEGGGTSGLSYTPEESIKEGLYKAKHQGLSMPNDVARDGLVKAGLVGETAKETLDGQWKAAQETSRKVKDEAAGNNRRQVTDHYEAGPNINDDHDRDRDRDTSS
ncbi:uncharacterized protein LOC21411222 isoform X1 [Morus notabilis]|uniref:uncharacterized protein LOC21411222 isoform X1 n=1 Tax=Morus notabilis TaxID=981085 RepID=UPI000CED655C|nr:uncharacterized protein LOC21411222 isoform X1 [Morus notabilis]XP_024027868.1 uncharacterized protein LOC21411222 isoform X1 [Morus notabilis]XP_024027869.1 uncharacterized protein LOC21411222 isoform X1 [Morus notabilis]